MSNSVKTIVNSSSSIREWYMQHGIDLPVMSEEMAELTSIVENSSKGITDVASGFKELDEISGGFAPGELIVVGARPGMGKTAFGLSMVANVLLRSIIRRPIALFSLEMTKEKLIHRLLCSEAQVDENSLASGNLSENDISRLSTMGSMLIQSGLYVVSVRKSV